MDTTPNGASLDPSGRTPRPEPCLMTIFGSRGDLARRKLWPALYNLALDGLLPEPFAIVGLGRHPYSREEFLQAVYDDVAASSRRPPEPQFWDLFARQLSYFSGDFESIETYRHLATELAQTARAHGVGKNRAFYLALPASIVPPILGHLRESGLFYQPAADHWLRVVFEKPFGHDLDSARALNEQIAAVLDESQVYRIDHYLAKENVQNLLVFRFGNSLFESAWSRQHIDNVQITMAEDIGVGSRGAFYEETGVIRDVVQNHLLQLLSLVAMESPSSYAADAIRDEKVRVLNSIHVMTPDDVWRDTVRGQCTSYRTEKNVAPDSTTPTYAALRLFIDNWRWKDVPFYIRAGKCLPRRQTEINIQFHATPVCLFGDESICRKLEPNLLTMRIQPHEGISLSYMMKPPGPTMDAQRADLKFCYFCDQGYKPPEAYERLILNIFQGDQTLFVRRDAIEIQWQVVMPILQAWEATLPTDFPNYQPDTWGPPAADEMLAREGRQWWIGPELT
ncbi:MAG: glucose-6-phosphate dehydrogenase [Armatimonadota bacterium]